MGAIVAANTQFHPERLVRGGVRAVRIQRSLEVIGMDHGRPSVPDLVGERSPGELEPRSTEPLRAAVDIAEPDHDRSRIRHRTKSHFALAEGAFGFTASQQGADRRQKYRGLDRVSEVTVRASVQ